MEYFDEEAKAKYVPHVIEPSAGVDRLALALICNAYCEDEAPDEKVSGQELKLARTLVEASTSGDFDYAKYEDEYTGKVAKLIESRAEGQGVVEPREHEEPTIINLMDALKQSVQEVKHAGNGKAPRRGRSAGKQAAKPVAHRAHGRRKTG